ncbi:peroxisomal membrane protein pex14 [Coemansia interrupta]|uniref:Peroxisomal membrane protein PEX14 n=1 Tax=Coemansia interrupta TaxID=1126814 RepID=A0A9W8HDM9_9FUNG|nr:peroxisomal membrane protein pex14 [Coemansia interrupta]
MSAEPQTPAAGSSPSLRQDIIESAVRFLSDPNVQSSTLAKKISFLETKGLTNPEIEDALARAKSQNSSLAQTTSVSTTHAPASAPAYAQPMAPPAPPPRPHLDWKDYFIAAVVAGGLGYGLYMFAKKYIRPLLLARDDNVRLEEEKKILLEQNEFTRNQLDSLANTTTRILESMAEQSLKTTEAIEGMSAVMDKLSSHGVEQSSSSRQLLITIGDLQREVSTLASKSAKSDNVSVADVQSDIRSLRSLLLSRRVPASSSSPAPRSTTPSAVSAFVPNGSAVSPTSDAISPSSETQIPTPTIPAWQLAMTNGAAGDSNKGKQPEATSD